ncbi:MAG: YwbE family protein [Flavobacteriales bacterium]|nr:YwbE family protein [Flavobacteriales bacterium]
MENLDGRKRRNVRAGLEVSIVQKHHQRSGELTHGVVKRLLTKSSDHPHGIKVQLTSGEVGRVKIIANQDEDGQAS